ncbi:uncharacterized protein LOC133568455 [Nerophis ophidion]|uniref:uncharacterized protein LOC133568455 n=1 Tax=Nerophis ophidion TaxID=159077 RepID=UPI002ADF7773|nr:uncharacterized protein LOC133568455 [Nerophis ophidion]
MYFECLILLMLAQTLLVRPVPVDRINVQIQQPVVLGHRPVTGRVLLNGVPIPATNQKLSSILQRMSADLLTLRLLSDNQAALLRNHSYLWSRDCTLEGSELQRTDRFFYDGVVYLSLNHNGTWTAHTLQAGALKALWERVVRRSMEDECMILMSELKLSEERTEPEIPFPQFLISILALLAFTGLAGISFLLATKQGLTPPGGVLGSIVHYPKNMAELNSTIKPNSYHTFINY